MPYYKKESLPGNVAALEILRRRLQRKYTQAESAQSSTKRPSGRMRGLAEAIQEVDFLIKERGNREFTPNPFQLSLLEAQTNIGHGVTLQSWFTKAGNNHIRSEVYLFEDGSVIAYQDCIDGVTEPLHMEEMFKALHESEPVYWWILHYAGVMDPSKVQLYYMGR